MDVPRVLTGALAGVLAAISMLAGSTMSAAAQASDLLEAAWTSQPRLGDLTWQATDLGGAAQLSDSLGRPIAWAQAPASVDGITVLTPPMLPSGRYTVTDGQTTLQVDLGGVDWPTVMDVSGMPMSYAAAMLVVALIAIGGLVALRKATRARVALIALVGLASATALAGLSLTSATGTAPLPTDSTGRISADTLKAVFASCTPGQNEVSYGCVQDAIARAAVTVGPDGLPEVVETIGQAGIPVCHDVAHTAGQAYWLMTRSSQGAWAGTLCDGGFSHGMQEGAAATLHGGALTDALDAICTTVRTSPKSVNGREAERICWHGSGHAAVRAMAGNLESALALCATLDGNDGDDAIQCQAGVGHTVAALIEAAGDDPRRTPAGSWTHPLEACAAVPTSVTLNDCYHFAGLALAADMDEPADLLDWCARHESGERLKECQLGVMRDFSLGNRSTVDIEASCSRTRNFGLEGTCIKAAVQMNLDMNHQADCANWSAAARPICRAAVADALAHKASIGDTSIN